MTSIRYIVARIGILVAIGSLIGSDAFSVSSDGRCRTSTATLGLHGGTWMNDYVACSPRRLAGDATRCSLFKRLGRDNQMWTRKKTRAAERFRSARKLIFKFFVSAALALFLSIGCPAPAQASTSASPATQNQMSRVLPSRSTQLDGIVDRYVQQHMFDDDRYDPVESAYKEAVDDMLKGEHPKALNSIATSVYGAQAQESKSATDVAENVIMRGIEGGRNFLMNRLGLSEARAYFVLAFGTIGLIAVSAVSAMELVANVSKRRTNTLMKKRYGDTYSVDASVKVEDDVELPSDEEEDEDEDGDDDDDNDDES